MAQEFEKNCNSQKFEESAKKIEGLFNLFASKNALYNDSNKVHISFCQKKKLKKISEIFLLFCCIEAHVNVDNPRLGL